MHSARLTLFTRANCSLCETAKTTIAQVQKKRPIDYTEIDIMTKGQENWKNRYEFDTPVLHVQRVFYTYSKPDIVSEAKKLMHRFSSEDVERLVDEAEAGII
jgi:glutaredoxin